jgi:hypothetical protein
MKRILTICFLVGFAFVFLTGKPTKAWACGICAGATCVWSGDIVCGNDQYSYPATQEEEEQELCFTQPLPNECWSGTGDYYVTYIQESAVGCYSDNNGPCSCPLDPEYFDIYIPC